MNELEQKLSLVFQALHEAANLLLVGKTDRAIPLVLVAKTAVSQAIKILDEDGGVSSATVEALAMRAHDDVRLKKALQLLVMVVVTDDDFAPQLAEVLDGWMGI